ncbi:MAG: hypothetical protein AAGI88_15435, partial [Pseudomonadota bacterium]
GSGGDTCRRAIFSTEHLRLWNASQSRVANDTACNTTPNSRASPRGDTNSNANAVTFAVARPAGGTDTYLGRSLNGVGDT